MALTRFFLEIIYFMKTLTKLVGSNMKVHDFFQLGRDTTGAWSVFHFLNSSQMPRTTAARIDRIHKIFTFFIFLDFFHPFESFIEADELFKNVPNTIFGVRMSEFRKIHDPGHLREPHANGLGSLFFYHMQEPVRKGLTR